MFAIIYLLGTFIADLLKSRRRLEVENLFLPHQLPRVERDAAYGLPGLERPHLGDDAPLAQVGHEHIEAAELEVAAEDGSDRLCFRLIDHNPAILRVIAERCHAADPETLALGGGDLVADAFGGDLALELGK